MPRKRKTGVLAAKRPKLQCEIDGCDVTDENLLHRHHIVERTEINTNNDDYNLAIICSNHHNLIHAGKLEIVGVFPGTRPPTGRILVYKLDGKCNFPELEKEKPYYSPKPQAMKVHYAKKT